MKKSSGRNQGPTGRVCMGRQVVHHSPDKHPEQDDTPTKSAYEQFLEDVDAGRQSGTLSGVRQDMRPLQEDSSSAARTLQQGLDYLTGRKQKKK